MECLEGKIEARDITQGFELAQALNISTSPIQPYSTFIVAMCHFRPSNSTDCHCHQTESYNDSCVRVINLLQQAGDTHITSVSTSALPVHVKGL